MDDILTEWVMPPRISVQVPGKLAQTLVEDVSMPIHQINHPLVRHKIVLMLEGDISTKKFRELTA